MPPPFTSLYGDDGCAVVVDDFTPASVRRASRLIWEEQVAGGSPFARMSEFQQLCLAGQHMTWYRYSDADPAVWGERWGEDGDLRDEPIYVVWFVYDDIPGTHAWIAS